MSRYAASGVVTCSTTNKTALGIQQPASSLKGLIEVFQTIFGSVGTPTDASIEWLVQRTSSAGTSSGVTPTDIDDTGGTPVAVVGQTFSAEPTYVSNSTLFDMGINQRATFTVVFSQGFGWKVAPTASRGMSVGGKHATFASSLSAVSSWIE